MYDENSTGTAMSSSNKCKHIQPMGAGRSEQRNKTKKQEVKKIAFRKREKKERIRILYFSVENFSCLFSLGVSVSRSLACTQE